MDGLAYGLGAAQGADVIHRSLIGENVAVKVTDAAQKEDAEALRDKLVARRKKQLYVETAVVIPCPLLLARLSAHLLGLSCCWSDRGAHAAACRVGEGGCASRVAIPERLRTWNFAAIF